MVVVRVPESGGKSGLASHLHRQECLCYWDSAYKTILSASRRRVGGNDSLGVPRHTYALSRLSVCFEPIPWSF
jgi:hypothetical protein